MQLFESVSRWFSVNPVVRRVRTGPRAEVNEQVLVRVTDSDEINTALLRDISPGGAGIRTDMRLTKGTTLWLRVNAGSSDQFEITAIVTSARPHAAGFFSDYGLRLVELDIESARTLGAFIEARLGSNPIKRS
jgi:hypothetical protein